MNYLNMTTEEDMNYFHFFIFYLGAKKVFDFECIWTLDENVKSGKGLPVTGVDLCAPLGSRGRMKIDTSKCFKVR